MDITDIEKNFTEGQEKYTYNIIALSVAAVGFSIYQTTGKPLNYNQVALAIAVGSWAGAVYCGLRTLSWKLAAMYSNIEYLKIPQGKSTVVGSEPWAIKVGMDTMRKIIEEQADKAFVLSKWMDRLFYFGAISFIVWHILEMSVTKVK